MGLISKIPPDPFTISAVVVALALTQDLTIYEQDSMGNWFQLVGQTLETYSTQITTNQQVQNDKNNMTLEKLSNILYKMKKELDKLKTNSD